MGVDVVEEPMSALAEYARVPISFRVDRVVAVTPTGAGFRLDERPVAEPWIKDYDADAGEGPTRWAARFDLSRWGLLAARDGGALVGGAVIAFDTPGVDMLEGRRDLAVLWDLRVAPGRRGEGIGTRLFEAAERWARPRRCRELKIETQDVNAAACRFYAARGCVLRTAEPGAYAAYPSETRLLWYRDLAGAGGV